MNKNFLAPFFFVLAMAWVVAGHSDPSLKSQIKTALRPPNSNWGLNENYTGEYRLLALGVKNSGQPVSFTVNYYEILEPAKEFLKVLREGAIKAPLYQGAEIQPLTSQTIDGKSWETFTIRGKEGRNQQVWARQIRDKVLLDIMYTATGDDFEKYRNEVMTLMKQASGF